MRIWLDDQLDDPNTPKRHVPEGWVGAKNFSQFKALVEQAGSTGEKIEAIDFDNDLGEPMEGKDILRWLMEEYPDFAIKAELKVHSANIEASKILEGYIRDCREHPEQVLEMKHRPSYEDLFGEIGESR